MKSLLFFLIPCLWKIPLLMCALSVGYQTLCRRVLPSNTVILFYFNQYRNTENWLPLKRRNGPALPRHPKDMARWSSMVRAYAHCCVPCLSYAWRFRALPRGSCLPHTRLFLEVLFHHSPLYSTHHPKHTLIKRDIARIEGIAPVGVIALGVRKKAMKI